MSLSIQLDDLFVIAIILPSAMAKNGATESICLAVTPLVCTWRFAAAAFSLNTVSVGGREQSI